MSHLSDQEQKEMLKKWWKEYGISILAGIAIFLLTSYGWRYWHNYKVQQVASASFLYSELLSMENFAKPEEVQGISDQLTKNYKNTTYASFAAFLQAKSLVVAGNYKAAEDKLNWVIKHGNNKTVRQIARVRLARVLLEDKKNLEAIDVLKKIEDPIFTAEVFSIRGDALLALGKKAEALDAYRTALKNVQARGNEDPMLEMKIEKTR
jgi:predicted negative regulator of RcsB-dependent stress response